MIFVVASRAGLVREGWLKGFLRSTQREKVVGKFCSCDINQVI